MAFTQNDDNQEQTQQNGALTTGGGQGSAVGNTPGAGPVSAANPNKQGSGRFTNLSKYVQANKQGSENLANRIGSGIQNQLSANEKDVSGKTSKLDEGIKSGDATLQTAGAEEQRLKSIGDQFKANQNFKVLDANSRGGFGEAQNKIKEFATNNPNYNTFKSAQAGSAVDEAALGNQLQDTQQTASQYQNLFNQRQAQIGNTQGREQALQEFIGGANQAVRPTYTSGQRKLDQLILGQNAQNLQGLINKVGANQTNVNQALNTVSGLNTGFNTLKTKESDLIKAIGDTSKGAQSAFQSAFNQDKIKEVNDARQQKYDELATQLQSGELNSDIYNKAISPEIISQLNNAPLFSGADNLGLTDLFSGVNQNDTIENTNRQLTDNVNRGAKNTLGLLESFSDPNALAQYISRQENASTANDIVNNEDVTTDKFLSDIVGGGQKFTKSGNTNINSTLATDNNGKYKLANELQNRRNLYAKAYDEVSSRNGGGLNFGDGGDQFKEILRQQGLLGSGSFRRK